MTTVHIRPGTEVGFGAAVAVGVEAAVVDGAAGAAVGRGGFVNGLAATHPITTARTATIPTATASRVRRIAGERVGAPSVGERGIATHPRRSVWSPRHRRHVRVGPRLQRERLVVRAV